MKNKMIISRLFLFMYCVHLIGAADVTGIACQRATLDHVDALLELINQEAYQDAKKIVIVPKAFRHAYIHSAIEKGRLFIATDEGKLIGYKKMFCITDQAELQDILYDELRCIDTKPIACGAVSMPSLTVENKAEHEIRQLLSAAVTYIYNGSDFTLDNYRGKGVNQRLTAAAFEGINTDVIEHTKKQSSAYVALLFGLTDDNAGKKDDLLGGRSCGIIKQFVPFVQRIAKEVNHCHASPTCMLSRYLAFKPSFDPDAAKCEPLPDDQSIEGCGCIIGCSLQDRGDV